MTTSSDIILALLSFLFPPLGVWVKRGLCSCDSLLNILLCCLGFIPGLIHAWYIIAKYPDEYETVPQSDAEGGNGRRVVYVHHTVGTDGAGRKPQGQGQGQRNERQNVGYGTVNTGAGQANGGEGGSNGQNAPPSYAEAVKGDNKVQGP